MLSSERVLIDRSKDDGKALLILLRIAHLEFDQVPRTELPFNTLLELAALCERSTNVSILSDSGWNSVCQGSIPSL